MKINKIVKTQKDIKYLRATMGVRYYQDCEYSNDGINYIDPCQNDTDEESQEMKKILPCIVKRNIGYGEADYWEIIIDLDNGKVLNWPDNFWLNTHFKVCDDGEYVFLDENMNEVVNITKECEQYYVPDFLSLEDYGYGDYVYLNIDNNGNINKASKMRDEIKEFFDNV